MPARPHDHAGRHVTRPRLVHLTTTDVSLALLLGPQLRAFAAAGYEVIAMSAPGPYVADLVADGIGHIPLRHATRSAAIGQDALALAELRRLFRTLRPDIVHTHNPKPGVYGRLAAKSARVPAIVNTVHGLYALPEDRWGKRAVVYSLERAAAACSDAELVQNVEDVDVLASIGVDRAKIRLLGNGVDLGRFDPGRADPEAVAEERRRLGVGSDEVLCGAVGRLVWEKGYRELLDAASRLRVSHPEARIVIVGPSDPAKADGLTDADIARARNDLGIIFTGARPDVEVLYAAMDVYVLASHREGFPRSAMEAAAMARPIVATDIRGCRQVVEAGHTGLLVAPRDADALAAAIGQLVDDDAQRLAMGQAGRTKALREFDQNIIIATTLETYSRLLAGDSRPPSSGGRHAMSGATP